MTVNIFGNLEIDCDVGTVYFHSSPKALDAGFSEIPLSISGLGEIKFPLEDRQIDIIIHQDYQNKIVNDRLFVKVQK